MNLAHSSAPATPVRKAPSMTDSVTALFHDAIASGTWPVGERIPVEAELMAWVGAGRNTVREAIQSLVQAGLVSREQGRGTFVIARSELVGSIARRASRASRRDVLELRAVLDGAAAALAAQRRQPADVAALQEALAARSAAWEGESRATRITADVALHRAAVAATGNELLVELYDGLVPLYEEELAVDVDHEQDPHADEHAALVQAIVDQQATDARGAVAALLAPLIAGVGR